MKRKLFTYKSINFPGYPLFLTGFFVGIIFPNLICKMKWRQDMIAALYLLRICPAESGTEYLIQVAKMRGGFFLLAAGSGLTIFGVPIAVCSVVIAGINIAMTITMSILQFGFHGGLLGAGLLFPQCVVYLPCVFTGSKIIFESSVQIWKNKNHFPACIAGYAGKMMLCGILVIIGILLETYCNPVITDILVRNLKFF